MPDEVDVSDRAFDAYQPPDSAAQSTRSPRPNTLTTVCVLAIILGVLGFFTVTMGMLGLFFSESMQQAFAPPAAQPGVPQEFFDAQQDMQDQLNAVTREYWGLQFAILMVHVAVTAALLVGGILALRLQSRGRVLLLAACAAAFLFELGRQSLYIIIQLRNMPILDEYAQRVGEAMPGGEVMAVFMKLIAIGGLIFGLTLVVLKLVYYGFAVRYLRRADVVRLFGDSASAAE